MCYSVDNGQTWLPPYFLWAQSRGIGGAWVVHIHRLPLQILPSAGPGSTIQSGDVATQSIMYMGASSGVYRKILEEMETYLPVIRKSTP